MKGVGYWLYSVVITFIALSIWITPFLAENHPALFHFMHDFYSPTCHQLVSRSFCYFPEKMLIADCTNETIYSKARIIERPGYGVGYKFPVCSRCLAIYTFAFLSALFYPLPKDEKHLPPLSLFIAALIPMAVDGLGQLFGFWESNNITRVITGGIAGMVLTFYIVPLLNRAFNGDE